MGAADFVLYNTGSRRVEPFSPLQPGKITLYVCGMTVYDQCHVGHARAMVIFDAFVRYLRHRGWKVRFVRNFTDVDDKIIQRANAAGEDPLALAERHVIEFHRDAENLGLLEPDEEPRVTQSMDAIQAMISALIDRGHAYEAAGSVWFAVASFDAYGQLSRRSVEDLRSADEVEGKRAPADFALWKAAKPDEPAWSSPWGMGRPGWHIECSAMAKACLGDTIDIHGGGLDLVFPHHENEIAQSVCSSGNPYARYWMHNGMLTLTSGQKMGKSLGNVSNVCDALREFPAETLRLYYLQNHYRSPLPWDDNALTTALSMLARLYEAREAAEQMGGEEPAQRVVADLGADAAAVFELGQAFSERYHACMDHDFNTAQALGHLFELARAINRFSNHKKAHKRGRPVVAPALAAFALVAESIGLMRLSSTTFQDEVKRKRLAASGVDRSDVERLIAERTQARIDKDWARADAIRDQLEASRIQVMDNPDGVDWRVRV